MATRNSVTVALWLGLAAFAAVTLLRLVLAWRALARAAAQPPAPAAAGQVTVLQPILSGDPLLEDSLARNLLLQPDAHFVWLVDEDDAEGQRVVGALAARHRTRLAGLDIVRVPTAPRDLNPKLYKLGLAVQRCGEFTAVLDDDTVLPAGSLDRARTALAGADLVTGLPWYDRAPGIWSALVAAFVNSGSALTYLPMAALGRPETINGMFWMARTSTLLSLGWPDRVADRLRDDLETARLFRAAGLRIVQSAIAHPVRTTVPGVGAYLRLMHRWMVFARDLVGTGATWQALWVVLLPSLLPLVLMITAVAVQAWTPLAVLTGALLLKAVLTAALRRRFWGAPHRPADIGLEILADLVTPLHLVGAMIQPHRVTWRSRHIETRSGGIHHS